MTYIVTQFARESFGICRFRGSCMREYDVIWLTQGIFKITLKQFAREDFGFALLTVRLVYEIILLNKIVRNQLLSKHLQWNYASFN